MMRKKIAITAVLLALVVAVYWIVEAGNLEPLGPPAPTMTALDVIDAKLDAADK